MEILFLFIFGLCLGSFANVLIWRLPKKESFFLPRSYCPYCKNIIKWYDNIPLVSYLFLKGKCRFCKNKISIRYPAVELITSIFITLTWIKLNSVMLFVGFSIFIFLLIVIAIIDYYHNIIPDELSILLIIVGLFFSFFNFSIGEVPIYRIINSVAGTISGGLLFFLVGIIGLKIFNKEALGGGDIKLVSGFGAFLGLKGMLFAIFIGSLIGTLTALILIYILKKKTWGEYLPYGPFLCTGAIIYFFFFTFQ